MRGLLLLLGVAINAVAYAQPTFTVSLLNNPEETVELGKPLWLELRSNTLSPGLRSIELDTLRDSFYVDSTADVITDYDQQRWQLRLYAYQTGNITIPALQYAAANSEPVMLTVTDPIEPKSGLPMPLLTAYSYQPEDTVWARQQVTLRYSIRTTSPYSQFRMQSATSDNMEMKSFVLPATQIDSTTFLHELGWSIHPVKHGIVRYEIPPLHYISDGVATHTFYHAPLHLNVTPLPLYVPATMPVGRLYVHTPDAWLFSFTNSLSEWYFTVSGDGMVASSIPDLSAAWHSHRGLRSYPAVMRQTEHYTASGIQTRLDYRLPFKTTSQGLTQFEPATLSYFDPASGRIHTLTLQPPYVISIRHWVAFIVALIILILGYYLLKPFVQSLRTTTSRYWLYRTTLQQLRRVKTACELRLCLRQFAAANGLSDNAPITDWLQTYSSAPTQTVEEMAAKLNVYFYHRTTTTDLTDLISQLYTLCRNYYRFRK